MPRYSRLAEFARTRGARDKRPRKRRNDLDLLDKEYKGARTNELRTRSIANLGRTLNSVGNSVREIRLTAKWLGIDPSRKRGNDPMSIVRNTRSVSDTGNSILRLGRGLFGMRSLNSMMAEFRRGKDKKKRRKRTLVGSAGKGAAIGMGVPLALGTLAGATGAGLYAARAGMKPGIVGLSIPAGGLGGLAATASKAPRKVLAAGALGGGIGAGLYGADRLKERNGNRSPLNKLTGKR